MDWSDFHNWNKQAVEKRDASYTEMLPFTEFIKWIDETSRVRL